MNRSRSGYVYIVLCAVIFSTMEVMLKTVHGVFAPMQITCLRFLVGGILLIPFASRSMKKKNASIKMKMCFSRRMFLKVRTNRRSVSESFAPLASE